MTLTNGGPAFEPFKGLDESGNLVGANAADEIDVDDQGDPVLVDNIMQFHVSLPNIDGNDADDVQLTDGSVLAGDSFEFRDPAAAVETRRLGLFEGTDEFGRIQPLLGVAENTTDINGDPVQFGPQPFGAPVTEDPLLGSTEVWEWYNFTEDAHPIHVHLVQYQVLEKRKIWFEDENEDGVPDDRNGNGDLDYLTTTPVLNSEGEFDWATVGDGVDVVVSDEVMPLGPEYLGNQDTVWIGPGEMLSAEMQFERPGPFVWHCHILSHEDHEMMRPFEVVDTNPLLA